jgi:hypothetical protein
LNHEGRWYETKYGKEFGVTVYSRGFGLKSGRWNKVDYFYKHFGTQYIIKETGEMFVCTKDEKKKKDKVMEWLKSR